MDLISLSFLFCVFSIQASRGTAQKDWVKFIKARNLVNAEFSSRRALGVQKYAPTTFEVLTDGIQYNVDRNDIVDSVKHGPLQADIIYGSGLILKKAANPITFSVDLPSAQTQSNICGLVITSLQNAVSVFVTKLRIMWKSDTNVPWDLVANPVNGNFDYDLRLTPTRSSRVIIFDSVPANQFFLSLTRRSGKSVNFKLAFLQSCRYKNTLVINNCGERIYQNPRFAILPLQVPISIKCPIDCIRTWPCWGFKVYSSDSPICWAATQNFGRYGDGYYTLYKIPMVPFFRSEVNPSLTHGVFCRRSILQYPGFTFDRKYLDFTVKEYRNAKGA